jgi:hypothetical protein
MANMLSMIYRISRIKLLKRIVRPHFIESYPEFPEVSSEVTPLQHKEGVTFVIKFIRNPF